MVCNDFEMEVIASKWDEAENVLNKQSQTVGTEE
jgi:hypothetical protein